LTPLTLGEGGLKGRVRVTFWTTPPTFPIARAFTRTQAVPWDKGPFYNASAINPPATCCPPNAAGRKTRE
jgi:hypothetical protein